MLVDIDRLHQDTINQQPWAVSILTVNLNHEASSNIESSRESSYYTEMLHSDLVRTNIMVNGAWTKHAAGQRGKEQSTRLTVMVGKVLAP